MRKAHAALGIAALALVLASCSYGILEGFGRPDPVGERIDEPGQRSSFATDKTLVEGNLTAGTAFTFIVSSDVHFGYKGGPRQAALSDFADLAKTSNADFALFGGDDADKGSEGEYQDFSAFADGLAPSAATQLLLGTTRLPWFSAVGNHDLYNSGWGLFRKYVGPSYYVLSVGSVGIYVIDTGNGTLGEKQLERLGAAMSADPRPKIVLSHYPIYGSDRFIYYRITNPRERIELIDLFARTRVVAVFVGHWHYPEESDVGPFIERVSGSLVDSDIDGKAHAWVVSVDATGTQVTATRHDF
ncbi:MAG TPA: metallophosphoesterase [Rectinemataceae bacterium]|nr:metallophosphoesterase [Rectinemataceae bacterium]